MCDRDLVEPRSRQRQIERGGDIVAAHRGAELPGDDVAGEVVEHGREIIPAPAGDLQVGEVGLPELVGRRGLVRNSDGALITMKAGLVIRSCAFRSRYTDASETK
jgi:hypothetical protein